MRKVSLLVLFVLLWLTGWPQKTDINGIDIYKFIEIVPQYEDRDNSPKTIQFTFQFHTEKELDAEDLLELFALSRDNKRASFALKYMNPWKEKFSKTVKKYLISDINPISILDTNKLGKIDNSISSKIYLYITNNNLFEIKYKLNGGGFHFLSFTTPYAKGYTYQIYYFNILGGKWKNKEEYYYGLTLEEETIPFEILEESYQKELLTKYYKILLERAKSINEYLTDESRLNPDSN